MSSPLLLLRSGRGKPTIDWSFLGSIPDGLTFTNASANRSYFDAAGVMRFAATNEPRFDYDPVTHEPLGLLIEEQRTNLAPYSAVTSGNFGLVSIFTSYNNPGTQDPTGLYTAARLRISDASSSHLLTATAVSFVNGTRYTLSAFVKADTADRVQLTGGNTAFGFAQYANFRLAGDGTVLASLGCTPYIKQCSNGWYRISITLQATADSSGTAGAYAFINSDTATRLPIFVGNDTDSLYIWGFQVEAAAFALSLIPTSGSAETRAADLSSTYSIPWFKAGAFSMLAEASVMGIHPTNTAYMAIFGNVTINAGMYLAATSGKFSPLVSNMSSGQLIGTPQLNTRFKTALAYRRGVSNGFAAKGALDNSGTFVNQGAALSTASGLSLGCRYDGTRQLNGHLRRFQYWNRDLDDSTLQRIAA
jgi:hypothetical protein